MHKLKSEKLKKKILLLSAYDAESHRYWWKGLISNLEEYDWTVLTLPARYFSWRIRGNALTWAYNERETLEQYYDLVIATSMTDLSTLRGFVPNLSRIPTVVYFHENQFDYPSSGHQFASVEPKVLNLYTALAADKIIFNTAYNLSTFLSGLDELLKKMPDHVPGGMVTALKNKAEVLPVPLNSDAFLLSKRSVDEFNIVWNHRWEYDKNPALLYSSIKKLYSFGISFKLHVVGRQFRKEPQEFSLLRAEFPDVIGAWGYVESKQQYIKLLNKADIVLSTALHDFQGIAVLEGVAAGAVPVVPNRLAYTELFPAEFRYSDKGDEAQNLADHLHSLIKSKTEKTLIAPNVEHLSWGVLAESYRQLIQGSFQS